jgi:hypothetical protein
MNEQELRASSLEQLKWSLQALALPYDAQRSLFPSFACTADELALDFDHWCETARHQYSFTVDQLSALASVSAVLSAMTDEKDADLWSELCLGASAALAGRAVWRAKSARGLPVEFGRAAIGPRRLRSIMAGKIVTAGLRHSSAGYRDSR